MGVRATKTPMSFLLFSLGAWGGGIPMLQQLQLRFSVTRIATVDHSRTLRSPRAAFVSPWPRRFCQPWARGPLLLWRSRGPWPFSATRICTLEVHLRKKGCSFLPIASGLCFKFNPIQFADCKVSPKCSKPEKAQQTFDPKEVHSAEMGHRVPSADPR